MVWLLLLFDAEFSESNDDMKLSLSSMMFVIIGAKLPLCVTFEF